VKIIFSNNSLKGADTISIIGQGIKNPTGVENRLAGIPDMYILRENYPNPFNPSTTIEYGLPHKSIVSMKVYSVLGQEVATLISQEQAAGYHQTIWNASNISSGIYFMRINAQSVEGKAEIFTQVKKMLLMK
jgi:hypothetical protein